MYDMNTASQAKQAAYLGSGAATSTPRPTVVDALNTKLNEFLAQTSIQIEQFENFFSRSGLGNVPQPGGVSPKTPDIPQGFKSTERALEDLQFRINTLGELVGRLNQIA